MSRLVNKTLGLHGSMAHMAAIKLATMQAQNHPGIRCQRENNMTQILLSVLNKTGPWGPPERDCREEYV